MSTETMADLRAMMLTQAKRIRDQLAAGKPVDRHNERLQLDICLGVIESAKVEVELAAVLKGSLEVPFIEDQAGERSSGRGAPQLPPPSQTPLERAASVLTSEASANHPWRDAGRRRGS